MIWHNEYDTDVASGIYPRAKKMLSFDDYMAR